MSSNAPSPQIDGLPAWLQPGVGGGMHTLLRAVLATLNALLGYCAIAGTLRPHFEILFLLSLALTACYAWLMVELSKLQAEAVAARNSQTGAGAVETPGAVKKES